MLCCKKRRFQWDWLQTRLSRLCFVYARFVAIHPYPFIILPLIVSGILSLGWIYKSNVEDVVYMFTPTDARSKSEQQQILNAFPLEDGLYVPGRSVVRTGECHVISIANDGGNILRYQESQSVIDVNNFVVEGVRVTYNGKNYTYMDLCLTGPSGCYTNQPMVLLAQMYQNPDPYMNLSYPTAIYNGQQHYLAGALGDVSLDSISRKIVNAKAWLLIYQLKFATKEDSLLSHMWEAEFERQMLGRSFPLISYTIVHAKSLDNEIQRNGVVLMPRFSLMFGLLLFFALLCTISCIRRGGRRLPLVIDWLTTRPYLAIAGVIGAGLGVASAIGFLSFVGLPYGALVSVMPFLIIAVRLDNTFLMIGALENTDRSMNWIERIAHAMSEAAVSITITVLTDLLSFGCGVFTDFPAVQIFCIYTTLAIGITFIYQLTFLLGLLALNAKAEQNLRHALVPCRQVIPVGEAESHSLFHQLFCLGGTIVADSPTTSSTNVTVMEKKPIDDVLPLPAHPRWSSSENKPDERSINNPGSTGGDSGNTDSMISEWIRRQYAPFLMRTSSKIAVLLALIAFWAVSIYGCSMLRQGLEPAKLLLDDSYAAKHYHNLERYFWSYGTQMQLAILRPGNLSDARDRAKVLDVLRQFAEEPYSIGPDGLDCWLVAFERFMRRQENRNLDDMSFNEFYEKLDYFLSFAENARYAVDVSPSRPRRTENFTFDGSSSVPVTAMRATIGLRGYSDALSQQKVAEQFRSLADSHPDMQLVVFNILFPFIDQYVEILPNVLQEIYSSVACMIGIALLLIPHPVCILWVTLAIASIDLGVIGFMTLWGLNMDTISMVTIIMSIGFSVDFTAHIAYAYVSAVDLSPSERITKALATLAWPVTQGAVSCLLGVIVLADLNSYMVVSFFKTVTLVILFGLLHALVFLPVLLNVSHDRTFWLFWRRKKTISASSSSSTSSSAGSASSAEIGSSPDSDRRRIRVAVVSRIKRLLNKQSDSKSGDQSIGVSTLNGVNQPAVLRVVCNAKSNEISADNAV